jgi:hypothetical protein
MLGLAKQLLEHVLKNTAIRDCRCAHCSGFKEEAPQWLEAFRNRPPESETRAPHCIADGCWLERNKTSARERAVCPQCGIINGFHRESCPLRHSVKAGCGLCAEGMNSFLDPNTGQMMHARNGTVTFCSSPKAKR